MTKPASAVLSGEEILDASRKEDWGKLWLILMVHTIKRLKYRYGIKDKISDLKTRAHDHLSTVMQSILVEGKRNWNTKHYTTFQDFVISVIDSELYNAFQKKPSPEINVDIMPDDSSPDKVDDDLMYTELKDEVYSLLESENATDEELLVFDCMADGIVKPMHIRTELGIDENTFRRCWRNLKVKLEKIGASLWKDE